MKKPKYYYNQSGVIPYRIKNKEVEVMLITSRKKKKWIIPKGIIENNLTPQESALKEALEEAGVSGNVSKKQHGIYKLKKWGDECSIKVYLMDVTKVLSKWPESFRERKWVPIHSAVKLVEDRGLIDLLETIDAESLLGS